MRSKAIKKWVRSGPLRSAYRRLVAACVCPLPFVPHNYPEPERQRRATARLRQFVDTKTFKAMQTSPGSVVRQCYVTATPKGFVERAYPLYEEIQVGEILIESENSDSVFSREKGT